MISEPLRRDIDRQEYDMKRELERAGITEYFDVLFCATADDPVEIPYVNPEVYGRMYVDSHGRRQLRAGFRG